MRKRSREPRRLASPSASERSSDSPKTKPHEAYEAQVREGSVAGWEESQS